MRILKSFKVLPRLHDFRYTRDNFFIYIYLNPFTEYKKPFSVSVGGEAFCFGYEPLYIGKGSGGSGYRQNQHISEFKTNKAQNPIKNNWFMYLEKKMQEAKINNDISKPWDWKEYQSSWVIIAKSFPSSEDLLSFEVKFIQAVGTKWNGTGPLVNKIRN